VETSDAVRDEMLDLVERLAALDHEQWNSSSLCARWRIRDVLAHMTAGAEGAFGVGTISWGVLRYGFHYNRWVAADGQERGQEEPAVILTALRNAAANRKAQPGGRSVTALAHVLIHGQDMCRPLGIKRDLPEPHLVAVANFVKDDRLLFGARRRIASARWPRRGDVRQRVTGHQHQVGALPSGDTASVGEAEHSCRFGSQRTGPKSSPATSSRRIPSRSRSSLRDEALARESQQMVRLHRASGL
jgi:uncharacterized protein (TIGR03083 family)